MKKLFIICVASLIGYQSFAQTSTDVVGDVKFGVKAGLNVNNFKGNWSNGGVSYDFSKKSLVGFNAGAFAHIPVAERFAVQPEVVFARQGDATSDAKFVASYVNIPVLAQYEVVKGLRIQAGPQLGILVPGASYTQDNGGNKNKAGVKEFVKSTDFSIATGLSYVTPIGLGIDARYNFGVADIHKSDKDKLRNNVAQIGLFYEF